MEQIKIDQIVRLTKLIEALGLNQTSFAKSIGMAQPNVSRMINGGGSLSVELLNRLATKYPQVNLHWLLTGIGEMCFEGQGNAVIEVRNMANTKVRIEALEEHVIQLLQIIEQLKKDF